MADKYIYAVARIRALEMSLMSQAAIEQLVATDSYKKAVQFIIEKGWGDSDNASMDENDILRAETDKTWAAVAEMVKLFYELNDKAEHAEISERAVDLRGLQDAIGLMQLGISIRTALDMGIINKCFDPHEQQLIRDVITARIPDRGGREVFD